MTSKVRKWADIAWLIERHDEGRREQTTEVARMSEAPLWARKEESAWREALHNLEGKENLTEVEQRVLAMARAFFRGDKP